MLMAFRKEYAVAVDFIAFAVAFSVIKIFPA